jgi:hypothetical protein
MPHCRGPERRRRQTAPAGRPWRTASGVRWTRPWPTAGRPGRLWPPHRDRYLWQARRPSHLPENGQHGQAIDPRLALRLAPALGEYGRSHSARAERLSRGSTPPTARLAALISTFSYAGAYEHAPAPASAPRHCHGAGGRAPGGAHLPGHVYHALGDHAGSVLRRNVAALTGELLREPQPRQLAASVLPGMVASPVENMRWPDGPDHPSQPGGEACQQYRPAVPGVSSQGHTHTRTGPGCARPQHRLFPPVALLRLGRRTPWRAPPRSLVTPGAVGGTATGRSLSHLSFWRQLQLSGTCWLAAGGLHAITRPAALAHTRTTGGHRRTPRFWGTSTAQLQPPDIG